MSGNIISAIYSGIEPGILFKKGKRFFGMLDWIVNHKVEKVVITYKDRLIRVDFELVQYFFSKFGI